jgi:BirA family transcriptional regulator, biotin operon repressor / biotin---[acetyl-CoA-carboxylase] ligase
MTIPANGYPLTAAVSPRVQVAEHTGSTNADLVVAASAEEYPHLSVLLTTDQRSGRGRLDRRWETPPGSALAVSVLLRVGELPLDARGWIPLAAGWAMTEAIRAQLTDQDVALKWPNDVLVGGRKICGILAEATLDFAAVVVGSGINTAMAPEQLPVETATSFAVEGEVCDEDRLMADYLVGLDRALTALIAAGGDAVASGLHADVAGVCGTLGRAVRVSLPDGSVLEGTATGIDAEGRLQVTRAGAAEPAAVSAGDIVHLRF